MRPIIDDDGDAITSPMALQLGAQLDSGDAVSAWFADRIRRGTFTRDTADGQRAKIPQGRLWEDLDKCDIPAPAHVVITETEVEDLHAIGYPIYSIGQNTHVLGRPSITRILRRIIDHLACADMFSDALENDDTWLAYQARRSRLHTLAGRITAARWV
ncbi:hypothetical protein [Gulosibacter molinativorax]|uniref:Uncharacterized protein n=1 Tax=Gulosibacter molinativorax TaxID=256821 RepID=A0ABT7C7N2_9MICO|nr:hypothetical protein [Gulosibacter molinativorax]MDJ1370666.1 hypothetical protein [Gulosibacter molinativorax]QUY63307.1 Hypotetical protein [Gulosibacter molinativorax]